MLNINLELLKNDTTLFETLLPEELEKGTKTSILVILTGAIKADHDRDYTYSQKFNYTVTVGDIANFILKNDIDILWRIKRLGAISRNIIIDVLEKYYTKKYSNLNPEIEGFFENLSALEPFNFIKDSEEQNKLDKKVETFLNSFSEKYLKTHTLEETTKYIEELIARYHKLIDTKRSNAAVRSLISSKLKYKHDLYSAKEKIHKYNKLSNDDLNPNIKF